uniref:Ig-like domain-containing protein n=1 Tax=Poecilia reticulata TaxID=8081 RepID=A0A3P9P5Z9_POERE
KVKIMSCHFMQSCILPCSLDNGDELIIHWFYMKGDLNVHSFYQNQDQLGNQNQRFRNRTSLFKDQIPRNNFSLKLTGVKLQDEGRYHCLKSSTKGFNELFINLKVDGSHSFINLMVDAPVTELKMEAMGNRMSCSSEGIYPSPEHSWSVRASSNTSVQSAIIVSRTAEQRYDINSSLTLSEGVSFLTFSCSFSTRRSSRKVTVFTPGDLTANHQILTRIYVDF